MPTGRSLGRLLFRSSLLLTGTLTFWWLALQTPTLALLRFSEDVALRLLDAASVRPITVQLSGDWTLRIPVTPPKKSLPAIPLSITSVEFTMSRSDLLLFTFSLPLYWGIALGAPVPRSCLRTLFCGAAAVIMTEVLSLMVFIEITAHSVVAQMQPGPAGGSEWPREFGNYLLTQVIPFAAPVLIAAMSNRELRFRVFPCGLFDPTTSRGLKTKSNGLRKPR